MIEVDSIAILREVEQDMKEGKRFYELQHNHVGSYFWDSMLSEIESLTIYAGIHQKEFGYYRMPAKRFPYAIYYDIVGKTVFVVAVLPMRRNPAWRSEVMADRNR